MDKLKYIVSALCGIVFTYFRQYAALYVLVATAALLDLATGVSASVIDGTGLSSKIARKGFIKKLVLLIGVGFGTFLDVLLPMVAEYAGVAIPKTMLFSTIICVYICLTECISIVENIYRCVGDGMPKWLSKLLKDAKDKIDHLEDDIK